MNQKPVYLFKGVIYLIITLCVLIVLFVIAACCNNKFYAAALPFLLLAFRYIMACNVMSVDGGRFVVTNRIFPFMKRAFDADIQAEVKLTRSVFLDDAIDVAFVANDGTVKKHILGCISINAIKELDSVVATVMNR